MLSYDDTYQTDILFGNCLFWAHRDAILCRKLLLVNGVEYFTRFLIVESLKNRIEFVLVLAIVIVILWDVVMNITRSSDCIPD